MTCSTSCAVRYSRARRAAFGSFRGGVLTEKDRWRAADILSLSRRGWTLGSSSLTDKKCFRSSQHTNPTTSLACFDQICPWRIAGLRSQATVKRPLHSSRKRESCRHIEFKGAIRIDVRIHQRRQSTEIVGRHAPHPRGVRQDGLEHQGVDVHQTRLEEM